MSWYGDFFIKSWRSVVFFAFLSRNDTFLPEKWRSLGFLYLSQLKRSLKGQDNLSIILNGNSAQKRWGWGQVVFFSEVLVGKMRWRWGGRSWNADSVAWNLVAKKLLINSCSLKFVCQNNSPKGKCRRQTYGTVIKTRSTVVRRTASQLRGDGTGPDPKYITTKWRPTKLQSSGWWVTVLYYRFN